MKIRKKTATLLALLAACTLLSVFAFAADSSYDSANDPIVSKSYLDMRVSELNSLIAEHVSTINSEISSARSSIEKLESENAALKKQVEELIEAVGQNKESMTAFEPVELQPGQKIYPKGGSLELVIRTGGGKVVAEDDQPISDMTVGKELVPGASVSLSHYILIPRDDGRGILITGESTWIMVRGNYEIK